MDFGLMHLPVYTALTASVLLIMQVVLMFRAIALRGRTSTLIGDGGQDEMLRVVRVHGNFIENAPAFMIGLALLEMMAGSTLWVAGFAAVFVLSRVAHAIGFSMSSGVTKGRLLGTMGTMLSTLGVAGYLAFLAIGKL